MDRLVAIPVSDLPKLIDELRRSRLLVTPEELDHRLPGTLPTGLPALDELLGGGLPEGKIVELASEGGAATSVAVAAAARFTREGALAAWIDRGDTFDPRAVEEAGVELARLLWCRPAHEREAVRAADVLLASGAFPLVVLDLWAPSPRRRSSLQAGVWLRLARDAETSRACLLVLGEGEAGSFAAATLRQRRRRPSFLGLGPGRTFEGMESTWRLERNKLGLPPGEVSLFFRAPSHLPDRPWDPAPGAKDFRGDDGRKRR